MVTISIDGDNLMVVVSGIGKVLALRSELTVPLKHVVSAKLDPKATSLPKGLKGPGTRVPGLIYAGTFHKDGEKVFWDVRKSDCAIVIELKNEDFKQLVVEVKDPKATLQLINSHIG
jgi:hypothetical protein